MRLLSLLASPLALLVAAACAAQAVPAAPVNLDFEIGAPGPPTGWFPGAPPGYVVELDSVAPHEGRWAAQIRGAPAQGAAGAFGSLLQFVDATPYRGQRVRFRAWVRTDLPATGAGAGQLMLRVDRAPGQPQGFFDNMGDRPIRGATGWRAYEIVGDVAPDATRLAVGAILVGSGRIWADAASIETLGPTPVPEAARPLTDRGARNVAAFARLLGYVRYFHPSDQAVATDWSAFAIGGVRAVEGAAEPRRLAFVLDSLFRPVAPTLVVAAGAPPASARAPAAPGAPTRLLWWRHVGVGMGMPNPAYRSERIEAPWGTPPDSAPTRPLRVELGGGVSALIPLALAADSAGTLPHEPRQPPASRVQQTGDDRATRLAAVALAWNVFEHFYPYFDVVRVDWSDELTESLRAAAVAPGECALLAPLRRMVAALRDGHGGVYHRCESSFQRPDVGVEIVEGQPTITAAGAGAGGLRAGDVVLRIDGRDVREQMRAREALISAPTPGWLRYRLGTELLLGPGGTPVRISVRRPGGDTASVVLTRNQPATPPPGPGAPAAIQELNPGQWYVDISRATTEQFVAALPSLERATGLVFDLRGYPQRIDMLEVLSHLVREPITSAQWWIPVVTRPDEAPMRFYQAPGWQIEPRAPYLAAPRVFLTDGRAISYAESVMGIIEHYRLAEIVGETTAGTNGNINPFSLPGGYQVSWTGMKVLKHDGSGHHGVGIAPTIPVRRTIAGVAAGRDEVLERALEALRAAATGGQ